MQPTELRGLPWFPGGELAHTTFTSNFLFFCVPSFCQSHDFPGFLSESCRDVDYAIISAKVLSAHFVVPFVSSTVPKTVVLQQGFSAYELNWCGGFCARRAPNL